MFAWTTSKDGRSGVGFGFLGLAALGFIFLLMIPVWIFALGIAASFVVFFWLYGVIERALTSDLRVEKK